MIVDRQTNDMLYKGINNIKTFDTSRASEHL